jgi:cysteine desulfurase
MVTVGGTAIAAATTAAWMSYTNKRFVPVSWIRKSLSTATATPSTKKPKSYYLDFNGTTPIYPEVFDAMTPYLREHFGNPSSSHLFGTEPRKAIERARTQILSCLLGIRAGNQTKSLDLSSVWFTGCGTESDNMAIRLALLSSSPSSSRGSKHIVTCNVEHPAIENYLRQLETGSVKNSGDGSDGVDLTVTRVPVDTEGKVSAKDVIDAITPDTVLVTLMLANNESGALQPVKEVAEECRRRGVLCHTDAAVSWWCCVGNDRRNLVSLHR